MKKILITYTVISLLFIIQQPTFALSSEDLLPKTNVKTTETQYVSELPRMNDVETYTKIVQIMLAVATALILAAVTFAGIKLVVSRGNADEFGKAKMLIVYALAGVAIIAAAYAISLGITKLKIFG